MGLTSWDSVAVDGKSISASRSRPILFHRFTGTRGRYRRRTSARKHPNSTARTCTTTTAGSVKTS